MARPSLLDAEREKAKNELETSVPRVAAVTQIASNDGSKDKQISAKVNEKVYSLFTQINKEQGLSNNSALNMLISKYVRENKGILSDLE